MISASGGGGGSGATGNIVHVDWNGQRISNRAKALEYALQMKPGKWSSVTAMLAAAKAIEKFLDRT